jgi:hypothetical protein
MSPVTQAVPDTCYDCGCVMPDGGQPFLACLWKSPAGGAEHWAEVEVCPICARRRDRRRRVWLTVLCILVALLTAAVAYPLLL